MTSQDVAQEVGASNAAASYRYMRIAVVIVVATLGVSLAMERWRSGCQLGSISASYYSPVHSIFVGALLTLGVVMIALKGRDGVEDMLFNVAGFLAPIVALVPTTVPTEGCIPTAVRVDNADLIRNNVPALFLGTVLAIGATIVIARQQGKDLSDPAQVRTIVVGIATSVAMLIGGVTWYLAATDNFLRRAHGTAAIAMFVLIWLAIVVNAGWPRSWILRVYRVLQVEAPSALGPSPTARHLRYRPWYRMLAGFMPVAAVLVVVIVGADTRVYWLEVAEIVPFAAFWLLQTLEGWETGNTLTAPAD